MHMEKGRRRKGRKRRDDARRKQQAIKVVHADRVSELPDDILISIIRKLTFREATATSLLSPRWRYLHTHATHLHFPPFQQSPSNSFKSEKLRFRKHVDLINSAMDSYGGGPGGVKELKLQLTMLEGHSSTFKKWVNFALTKHSIESVEIRMDAHWSTPFNALHAPPGIMLGLSELVNSGQRLPASKSLKVLRLEGVGVNDRDLGLVVSGFVALESFCIGRTAELERVSIVGHPKLKHLDISRVSSLRSLEVRDVANLASMHFLLPRGCALRLQDLPAFAEFSARECIRDTDPYCCLFAGMASGIRDQLQLLRLSTPLDRWPHLLDEQRPRFQFVNLKHLEVEVNVMRSCAYYFHLFPLLEACQSIEKFKIKFVWRGYERMKFGEKGSALGRSTNLSSKLKEVEMEGYAASESEFQLASYIINCAQNLGQMIVVVWDVNDTVWKNCLARAREDFQRIGPPPLLDLQII